MPTNVQACKPAKANDGRDNRIVVRFGDRMLEAGHTAVPNLVLRHYAGLGLSPAELVFVLEVWTFWWSERDPYPSLGTIAERMGISRRQARNYVHSLKERGYLLVNERVAPGRGQLTSEYDFGPFLEAIRKLDTEEAKDPRNDPSGGAHGKRTSEGPGNSVSPEEDKEQEDSAQASNAAHAGEGEPQAPHQEGIAQRPEQRQPPHAASSLADLLRQRAQSAASQPRTRASATSGASAPTTTPYLDQMVTELSDGIGDGAHLRSNLARTRRLMGEYALDESAAVAALLRAHSLLKARSREGNRPVRRAGAYLFAILEDLLAASRAKRTHRTGPGVDNVGRRSVMMVPLPKRPG